MGEKLCQIEERNGVESCDLSISFLHTEAALERVLKTGKTRLHLWSKGPFVNYVSILGYLVGQKRAIFAYF